MSGGVTAELHLRMTGRLLWSERADQTIPLKNHGNSGKSPARREAHTTSTPGMAHIRLTIGFASGTLLLIDPRRFATFAVNPLPRTWALVEDPLAGISAGRLREIAGTRRLPVKSLLMDQRLIAGIGNIYACEILFAAGIDPRRPVCELSPAEWRRVARATPPILEKAVGCRGTTVSDWRDLFGKSGSNQEHLAVYSRQGKACVRCGGIIERIRQSGRGSWLCPSCQR
jgi:formamidopyrimidine-DNA glycosylase